MDIRSVLHSYIGTCLYKNISKTFWRTYILGQRNFCIIRSFELCFIILNLFKIETVPKFGGDLHIDRLFNCIHRFVRRAQLLFVSLFKQNLSLEGRAFIKFLCEIQKII